MLISIELSRAELEGEITKRFDGSSKSWNDNPDYNRIFLRAQEQYMNDLLEVRGHVFLNEVYDALGMQRTRLGGILGWLRGRDSHIDFAVGEDFSLKFNAGIIINDI